jgi:hypothetical protein
MRIWAIPAMPIVFALLAVSAHAKTVATLEARLSPERLGSTAADSVRVQFDDKGAVVPTPLRRAILRLPAGLTLEVPHLRSCSPSRLRILGRRGCPAESALGRGHALIEAYLGSKVLAESISLWVFLGPPRNLQPTVEILAQGFTPLEKQVVLSGSVLTDSAPYGERLVLSIPPIATLPQEPDASIASLSLTVGATGGHHRHGENGVRVPRKCPFGGFPVAGEFTYADGSGDAAHATIPCPDKQRRR